MLTRGIPPDFRDNVHLFFNIVNRHRFSPEFGVHCRESAGAGPEVLKAIRVTDAAFSDVTMDQFLCTCLTFGTCTTGTYGIPPDFRGGVHLLFKSPYAIGSVPNLSGHTIAYPSYSLPRVRRHRASKSQGIVLVSGAALAGHHVPINVPLFSHTRYWYEVGMLEVWAKQKGDRCTSTPYCPAIKGLALSVMDLRRLVYSSVVSEQ